MNFKILLILLSLSLISCDPWWSLDEGYVVNVQKMDSSNVLNFTISSIEPIKKNLGSVLEFNPYSDTSKYELVSASRRDTFMLSYQMRIEEDEVEFTNFKFHSKTIKQSKISIQDYYTFESPFLTIFID